MKEIYTFWQNLSKLDYRKKSIRDQPSMLGGDFGPLKARISCQDPAFAKGFGMKNKPVPRIGSFVMG
jgi:hypothetical protein